MNATKSAMQAILLWAIILTLPACAGIPMPASGIQPLAQQQLITGVYSALNGGQPVAWVFQHSSDLHNLMQDVVDQVAELARVNGENAILADLNTKSADRVTELEAALLIYADMSNWSVRSLLPEDYAEPDEWLGPEIPGYTIARRALERDA